MFGIELLDVRFKRINYNQSVRVKIYDRMISERQQIAEKFRSEGQGEAAGQTEEPAGEREVPHRLGLGWHCVQQVVVGHRRVEMPARGAGQLLAPLGEETADWMAETYAAGPSWVDLGTYADASGASNLYGFFYKVDVKSLVWYVPENFEDAGYEVPETMEDLLALSAQIVEDGETPWCIGLGSGAATGWPATDWVEDIMLRKEGTDACQQLGTQFQGIEGCRWPPVVT